MLGKAILSSAKVKHRFTCDWKYEICERPVNAKDFQHWLGVSGITQTKFTNRTSMILYAGLNALIVLTCLLVVRLSRAIEESMVYVFCSVH